MVCNDSCFCTHFDSSREFLIKRNVPVAAGVAALVWGYFPDCSNNQIRNVLALTASSTSDCDSKNGFGIIQAKAAFDMLDKYGCAAGGDREVPLSLGAVGGCEQPLVNVSSLEIPLDLTFMHTSSNNDETCHQLLIEILTDIHAAEIEWLVEKFEDGGSITVAKGPPEGENYRSESLYTVTTDCLTPGDYDFTISGRVDLRFHQSFSCHCHTAILILSSFISTRRFLRGRNHRTRLLQGVDVQ